MASLLAGYSCGKMPHVAGDLLDVLECPSCGGQLNLEGSEENGVLSCACNAYPLVAAIPVLKGGSEADAAIAHVHDGAPERALATLLGLDEQLSAAVANAATFREALSLVCSEAEASYLLFRFSDPTFAAGDALVRASAKFMRPGRALDCCGGSGHLTRTLTQTFDGDVFLADVSFRNLWLAKRFVAPRCRPVCCDANLPLPFAAGVFGGAVCSDAFHYIWHKRSLINELVRAVGGAGPILLPHVHNATSWNCSEGMPLPPAGYRRLLPPGGRIYAERELLVPDAVDLTADHDDAQLEGVPALALVWSPDEALFAVHRAGDELEPPLALNPLFSVDSADPGEYVLRFPSSFYEDEFGDATGIYLPARVRLSASELERARTGPLDGYLRDLARRRVLLPLPDGYLEEPG